MSSSLPNEIFAKILGHFRPKASHCDMQNLEKAIDHPDLDYLLPTFDFFTSRSKSDKCEDGNFICPICLFAQREIYDDSIWDTLCESVFGCSFVLHGAYGLVKTRPKAGQSLPSKRKFNEMAGSKSYWIQFLHSHEFLMKQSRSRRPKDEYCQIYAGRVNSFKANAALMTYWMETKLGKLKIFTNVGEFIDHVNKCDSHFNRPPIKIKDDYKAKFPSLNFDALFNSKMKGEPIDTYEYPRCAMKKLLKDPEVKISDVVPLQQPDPKLFDAGSQNCSFVEFITWPALTFALSFQLQDHICYPTSQYKSKSKAVHKALALRDLLRCMCEVFEKLDYDFEPNRWMKAKFAAFHGMLEILDEFFLEY